MPCTVMFRCEDSCAAVTLDNAFITWFAVEGSGTLMDIAMLMLELVTCSRMSEVVICLISVIFEGGVRNSTTATLNCVESNDSTVPLALRVT
jgi:hypothetical protein